MRALAATTLAGLFTTCLCYPPPPPSCSGVINTLPLYAAEPTHVLSVANGSKWEMRYGNDTASPPVLIVHLYGDDAAMGRAYGTLLKDELRTLLPQTLTYLYSQLNSSLQWIAEPWRDTVMAIGLEAALNLTWEVTSPFSPPHWTALLEGIAEGSGIPFWELVRFSMIPELLRAQCSILGAWGAATADGGLVQLRALDWDTDGPFQQFPLVAFWHPTDAASVAHTSVAWPGILGALTGFSSSGLGISEKVFDAYTGPNARLGYAWNFLLADILRFDVDLDAALSRIAGANRTCSIWIGIGDGGTRELKIVGYSHTSVDIRNARTWRAYENHDRFIDALFVNKHVQPSSEPCMNDALHAVHGSLDAEGVWRYIAALEATGDAHTAVYDFERSLMYFATAAPASTASGGGGAAPAYSRTFMRFDMAALWALPPPTLAVQA